MKRIFAIILTDTCSFQRYTKWLYLNEIEYELYKSKYEDYLDIIIYVQPNKTKRRASEYFMSKIYPVIKERYI